MRKNLLVILLATSMILVATGCQTTQSEETPVSEQESLATPFVSVTGKVKPVRYAELSFNRPGMVQDVFVREGDHVEAGQVLAVLDAPELEAAVEQAQAGVEMAKAQLAKVKAGARPEQVASAEQAVIVAREVVTASIKTAQIAQMEVDRAQAAVAKARAGLNLLQAGARPEEVEIARQEVERAKAERYSLQANRDVIGGQKDKPGYKPGSYEAAEGQVMAAETAVAIAELNYQLVLEGARDEEIASAEADLAQAQAALKVAQEQASLAEQRVVIDRARLRQAEAELALIKAPPRAEDITLAEAQLAQAEANLRAAQAALAKAQLVAPFAGTICELNLRPGEHVMGGMPVMALGDLSALQVETTDWDEIDIRYAEIGRKVKLTFDALPGVELLGTIQRIALKASASSGGTTYKVTIGLDEVPPQLRWGMTAFADISAE